MQAVTWRVSSTWSWIRRRTSTRRRRPHLPRSSTRRTWKMRSRSSTHWPSGRRSWRISSTIHSRASGSAGSRRCCGARRNNCSGRWSSWRRTARVSRAGNSRTDNRAPTGSHRDSPVRSRRSLVRSRVRRLREGRSLRAVLKQNSSRPVGRVQGNLRTNESSRL